MIVALTTDVQRASTVFAVLEVVALAFLAVVVCGAAAWIASRPWRRRVRPALDVVGRWSLWAAFAVAATCTGGSLWLSEVGNLPPCQMCWFQRICMYPLTVVTGVAALRRDRNAGLYALPLTAVGAGLSVYHYLLEHYPSLEGASGCSALNPCNIIWFERFGFATIPFMALTGFVTIAVLVGFAMRHPVGADRAPSSLEPR